MLYTPSAAYNNSGKIFNSPTTRRYLSEIHLENVLRPTKSSTIRKVQQCVPSQCTYQHRKSLSLRLDSYTSSRHSRWQPADSHTLNIVDGHQPTHTLDTVASNQPTHTPSTQSLVTSQLTHSRHSCWQPANSHTLNTVAGNQPTHTLSTQSLATSRHSRWLPADSHTFDSPRAYRPTHRPLETHYRRPRRPPRNRRPVPCH